MPIRKTPLATGEYYHIYNRGVARQPTFLHKSDYKQAVLTLEYYRINKPQVKLSRFKTLAQSEKQKFHQTHQKDRNILIDIISFVFMPNHFHLLLRQTQDNGISLFLSHFTNSYTRYFNTRHDRIGPLFQGTFKAVHIDTEEQLIHVSRYIHLNPSTSYVVKGKNLPDYPWSSLPTYLQPTNSLAFVNPQPILSAFKSTHSYQEFIFDHMSYARKLKEIAHLTLEPNS